MFDFSRHAARFCAAIAATLFLVSCGGSSTDTPAPLPFGSTTAVIGASLSDNGNACIAVPASCPPSPPYAAGVASNGTLWVTTVAARYGAQVRPSLQGGTNFAYGGARTGVVPGAPAVTTPNMVQQTESLLARFGFVINPQFLVIVDASTFGNNINAALTLAGADPANATTIVTNTITAGVTDVVGILNRLYAAGARNILFVNVPDVGKTPLVQATGNATVIATATTMSAQFNGAMAQQIANVRAVSPGLVVSTLDLFGLLTQVQANPAAFGFGNATAPCFVPPTATTPASLCSPTPAQQNTYVFWDPFHPTAGTGAVMAQYAINAIGR
jgi:outer membrane lipase/esterase